MDFLHYLWLIPVLPLAGAALNGVLGPRAPKGAVTAVGVGAPGLAMLLALGCLWQYLGSLNPQPFEQILYPWFDGYGLAVGFMLDPLSAIMLFVVTFVGFWIHVYSAGYMGHEGGYQRYFVYLNLFMGAMLLLILGNNYLISFVGWEGVGLCSYLLIGFYYDQEFPPYAGKKAFIVNRVGDFAFLVGLFTLISQFGSLRFLDVLPKIAADPAAATQPYLLGLSVAGFVALCLFVGAMGKSAQIPLYVWLPDAMAGPTPVSALIHAATMVTAGVYMVVRSNVLYQLAPGVSQFVAVIGALTAIVAATIGLAQNDIKKVLAYSTVSQLGYMFLAAGVGAYSAAIFHLGTHAFFKALLFLGSGSVIHAMSGEQDMRSMGGLKAHLPTTYRTFLIATIAIAGIPPLAGFFSKDEILAGAFEGGHYILWTVGLLTAGLTACYMFRAVFLTFYGKFRGTHEQEHHLHESPAVMTVPLIVLAVGAVVSGWLGLPGKALGNEHLNWIHHFLDPVIAKLPAHEAEAAAEHGMSVGLEWGLMLVSVAVAIAGILIARRLWGGERGLQGDEAFAARFPAIQRTLENKYWVDEAYDRFIVRPLAALARACWKVVDVLIIDGSVHVGAFFAEITGDLGRLTTTGNVRNYALYFFGGLVLLFAWMIL
jgi:NADH-quinone oxidoreductase subunit L